MKTGSRALRLLLLSCLSTAVLLVGPCAAAATLTVTNTNDSGPGSLRQAILDSNATTGVLDTITFSVSGAGCVGAPAICTIAPISLLPSIDDPAILDATTQPGYAGSPLIQIITSSLSDGLLVTGGGTTIKGLSISGFNYAVRLTSVGGNTIQANWIGLRADGSAGGNFEGIHVSSSSNQIGGTTSDQRNVVSTNLYGIVLDTNASNNSILGNFVGTNPSGLAARPNGTGVSIDGSINVVGGTVAGSGNLISGNGGTGLSLSGLSNFAQGNMIGTDTTGVAPLPNGDSFPSGSAVAVGGALNQIGGTVAGAGNAVAFNAHAGVSVLNGTGHRILGNSIFANGGLGIDLGGDGVTPNDPCDTDTGPNNFQNFPVLTTASSSSGSTTIQGTLNSVANTTYRIEFFSNPSCDSSGHGEGQTFLGSATVTTDGSCSGGFNVTLPVAVSPQAHLTATATDPAGNTSEFSACTSLQAQFFTVTPCRLADTRNAIGPYGGPALVAISDRSFVIGGQCGVPADAQAVVFNFTITQPTALGDLRTFPRGGTLPLVSTLNWSPGQTRANNAIVSLGPAGDLTVHLDQESGTVHLIIDVNGYFR